MTTSCIGSPAHTGVSKISLITSEVHETGQEMSQNSHHSVCTGPEARCSAWVSRTPAGKHLFSWRQSLSEAQTSACNTRWRSSCPADETETSRNFPKLYSGNLCNPAISSLYQCSLPILVLREQPARADLRIFHGNPWHA